MISGLFLIAFSTNTCIGIMFVDAGYAVLIEHTAIISPVMRRRAFL